MLIHTYVLRVSAAGLLCVGALAACAAAVSAGEPDSPFPVEWRAGPQSPADVSFLLKGPAGKDGFICVRDGRLSLGDGRRIRLWGVNVSMAGGLPTKEAAPVLAANLARVGVNCVRFHFLDQPAPGGIIATDRDDTRALDPAQMDRLDFFISELKVRGIYADLNLNVARSYKPGDGVRECELLGFAKSLTYFDPRILELQREYARQLLTHRNPYTQSEYRSEPAVALVEFVNENSLVEAWFNGRLLGRNTTKNPGTWTDIPASYAQALTEKYNAWLKGRYPAEVLARWRKEAGAPDDGLVPRLEPPQFAKASADRFHAEAAFYMDVEREYFAAMSRYLRDELAVRPLLAGNSDHGHSRTGYPQLVGTSMLDVVDSHVYWQHPNYRTDAAGKRAGFDIPNTPMASDPFQSTIVQLSRSAVAGKPLTVSEVNHPFPNEYACEGIPILAAYGAFQDWDGVFWYTLGHRDVVSAEPRVAGHFDLASDPVKMCQLAAGALLFLRGDVQTARRTVDRSYTMEQVRESIRLPSSERPYFTPGFPRSLPLEHAVRIRSFEGPPTGKFDAAAAPPVRSDTGELAWLLSPDKKGLVAVDTPRSQALIGFCRTHGRETANLAATVETPFCAITLHALDEKPIAKSSRLLLTAAARIGNSKMEWNEKRTSLTAWGAAPTVVEPVTGTVVLKGLDGASAVSAQPLDGGGKPLGPPLGAERASAGWVLPIGKPPTVWYAVTVSRQGQ